MNNYGRRLGHSKFSSDSKGSIGPDNVDSDNYRRLDCHWWQCDRYASGLPSLNLNGQLDPVENHEHITRLVA